MPSGALVAMAILVAFSGAANASILTTGSVTTPIDETTGYTISAIYRIGLAAGAPGTLTIDNGSALAQTDSIMLMGHVSPATVTLTHAWGDMATDVIQPFWATALCEITGIKFREMMGYCVAVWIPYLIFMSMACLFVPLVL